MIASTTRASRSRAAVGVSAADRRDHIVGAGEPQTLLAAEMVGDAGDIGPRRRRHRTGRGGLEALRPEQVERSMDQRQARRLAAAFGRGEGRCFRRRDHVNLH